MPVYKSLNKSLIEASPFERMYTTPSFAENRNNMSCLYHYMIVGSGLFGATFAYRAKQAGKRCLVIEKRSHVGGNLYCQEVEGIQVHLYGAHIFHTNSKQVWGFVNSLVEFNRYTNSPIANYKGELYNLPFNMNTFHRLWGVETPSEARSIIEQQTAEEKEKLGGRAPANLEEQALCLVGKDIYIRLIKDYTEKQWGRPCRDLPSFIIKRLPVRLTYDNNYFNDTYQGVPIGGYNKLIDKLLDDVECHTGVDFFRSAYHEWQKYAERLVYTGPIDEFFDYKLGRLDWRTVSFKTRVENTPNYQGNAVVNYTSHDKPYTRVIEHKHFERFGDAVYASPKTVISEEYSTEYEPGMEPYYPVNNERNEKLAQQYHELASQQKNVIFGGRLAQYKYFDMAPIIEQVLNLPLP